MVPHPCMDSILHQNIRSIKRNIRLAVKVGTNDGTIATQNSEKCVVFELTDRIRSMRGQIVSVHAAHQTWNAHSPFRITA